MMYLLIMFALLVSISVFLAWVMKYRFEQTIALTCFALIAILYICGLAGRLELGVYACIAAGIGSIIFCGYGVLKGFIKGGFLVSNIITPGFGVFCLLYMLTCFIHSGRLLVGGDEFSHWGRVVKNMYIFDAFGNHPDATTLFPGYPPGTALFQYLWMKICGYVEPNLFRSMNILSFSLVLPVFKNVRWSNIKVVPFIALAVFLLPFLLYPEYYTEIYVDAILGVLFAYILFAYLTEEKLDLPFMINISLAEFVLTLTKASGFGLSIIASLIITFDLVYKHYASSKSDRHRKVAEPFKDKLKRLYSSKLFQIPFLALLVPIATNYSWSLYRQLTNTGYAWRSVENITFSAIVSFLKLEADPYRYTTLKSFLKAVVSQQVSTETLTYFQFFLLITFALYILRAKKPNFFKGVMKNTSLGLFAGGALYGASLLVLYIFTYSEYEAVRLASFERYLNTYLLAVLLLLTCLFIYYLNGEKTILNTKNTIAPIAIIAGVLCFIIPMSSVANLFEKPVAGYRAYDLVDKVSALSLDYKSDKIYFICQNSMGYEKNVAEYMVTPIRCNSPWSLGTPYHEGDVWTRNISCEKWLEDLGSGGYTYVWLESIDEQFIAEFGAAFEDAGEIMNGSMYAVRKEGGAVLLRLVDVT